MLRRMAPLVTVVACVTALAGHVVAVGAASGESAAVPQLRTVSTRDDGRVSSVVIEQGKRKGLAYRLESIETYVLEKRAGKWLAIRAETTQR